MKSSYAIFSLIFLMSLSSCNILKSESRKVEEKIVGMWDIKTIVSSAKPDSVLIPDFNNMLRTILINAIIEFETNHSFNLQIEGKIYSGSWTLDGKSRKLTLTEKKEDTVYSIIQSNETEMQLTTRVANEDFSIILHKMHP